MDGKASEMVYICSRFWWLGEQNIIGKNRVCFGIDNSSSNLENVTDDINHY